MQQKSADEVTMQCRKVTMRSDVASQRESLVSPFLNSHFGSVVLLGHYTRHPFAIEIIVVMKCAC